MRIFDRSSFVAVMALALVPSLAPYPAFAFDGSTDSAAAGPALPGAVSPAKGPRPLEEAVRFGSAALRSGATE